MLKPDDARRELGKFKSLTHKKARQERLLKLQTAAGEVGLLTLAHDAEIRKEVLNALYPTFAEEIERGLLALRRLPYTTGYSRRPYRAPAHAEYYAKKTARYLMGVDDALEQIADDALTPEWVATWAVHLQYDSTKLGYLFAAQIDAGRTDVLEILKDSAANRHPIGGPGHHAVRGLLCCEKPEAWEFVANLLLAAQRQEGLRQVILEAVDEAHPTAFRQLLGIILDHNLIRFAAAARGASVWLGERLMVEDAKALNGALSTVREFLDEPAAREKALKKGDAATLYRALWTMAFEDVSKAVLATNPVLKEGNSGRKIAAVKFLGESNLKGTAELVLPLLEDSDPVVLSATLSFLECFDAVDLHPDEVINLGKNGKPFPALLFDKIEKLLPRLPEKPQAVKSPVPTWPMEELSRKRGANLLVECLQARPAERLLPHLKSMSPEYRVKALAHLCTPRVLTNQVRGTLMACAAELDTRVREAALRYLKQCTLAEDEVMTLEGLLTRKQPDFRRSVFELLLNRPDKLVLKSIERLLSGDAMQRAAGIELARRMADADRAADGVQRVLSDFLEVKRKRLTDAECEVIDRILDPEEDPPSLANGLGLFEPSERTPIVPPRDLGIRVSSPAAATLLRQLDDLVYENRSQTFKVNNSFNREVEFVIGSIRYYRDMPRPEGDQSLEQNLARLPFRDLWFDWFEKRIDETRDADGFELVRALLMRTVSVRDGEEAVPSKAEQESATMDTSRVHRPETPVGLRHDVVTSMLIKWLLLRHLPTGGIEFALDALEQTLALIPQSMHDQLPRPGDPQVDGDKRAVDWRKSDSIKHIFGKISSLQRLPQWTGMHSVRLYQLRRWVCEPIPDTLPIRADIQLLLEAFDCGGATLADFYDDLIGPRERDEQSYDRCGNFSTLKRLTCLRRWPDDERIYDIYFRHQALQDAVAKVVTRIVEVEITRGETPTAASAAVSTIGCIEGIDLLFPLIAALGKSDYKFGYWYSGKNRPESLTELIVAISPRESDTPDAFINAIKPWLDSGKISQEKLVALGLVNTKLIKHVAAVIRWPGYEEACYWFMAHAGGSHADSLQRTPGEREGEYEKSWRAIVKARSNLTAEQRADGVIDVDWFHRAYQALRSEERWEAIEKAARFLGYGYAEKKAARLADVLLGHTKKKKLVEDIQKKYLKESVRLLGLLPLAGDAKKRAAEVVQRYKVLKAYERYARGLSSLTKEPAMQAYRLGMENLAITAGFSDSVRLEWAVTASETADLAKGKVSAKAKDVTVTLELVEFAEPISKQYRGQQELKSLPKEAKANKAVAELLERKKDIQRLVKSTKQTLELAMCAGDHFTAEELRDLLTHPLVRPFLERLVLKTEAGMGYPVKGGEALRDAKGKVVPLQGAWSIAHPLDFVKAKNWHDYQSECFRQERIQPFKQVFREVYTLSPAEKEDGDKSRRFSGQQVNDNQAKALLGGRGWSTRYDLSKLFRADNLLVELILDYGYSTPGDAAAPAVKELQFFKRGEWKPMLLQDVPEIIFSEVMRDLDLVVSVAHVGGVDPEATQSTLAMRSSLLQETCTLLKLANVKLESKHVHIRGEYGQYSVHLGSGVVHKQPGGSLCVVAVNAQHRGRLFLPFADDDPRTAEIISKVLLLARDKEIQDPTILAQITAK